MNGKGDQLSRRLLEFIVGVIHSVDKLPNTAAGRHMGNQLLRAGTSCGANYEEGCAAESRADFIHKLGLSLKELKETRYWLRLIQNTKMLDPQYADPLFEECDELCAIIGKSISTARNKRKQPVHTNK